MNRPVPERIQATFSRLSLLLEPHAFDLQLGNATGFVIQAAGLNYLVTNWHVVAGRDAETNECLSRQGALPTSLTVYHHSSAGFETRERRSEPLFHNDDMTQPRWLEHPRGRAIDVVLLPLADTAEPVVVWPLDAALARARIIELPGLPVSIVGFPFGYQVAGRWPIWKTGHIASDSGFDYDDRPSFLIDITARKGMSGSPIVYQNAGPFDPGQGEQAISTRMQRKFLGIYSGRLREDSEIARGWRARVIDEILAHHDLQWR